MCLEERIKMLQEEINRQSLQRQIFTQVDAEKKQTESSETPTTLAKEMVSIEIQANEQDIRDALPESYTNGLKNSKVNELLRGVLPERLKFSPVSLDNKSVGTETISTSPLNTPITKISVLPLDTISPSMTLLNNKAGTTKQLKEDCHVEESDSDDELKIVFDGDSST